MVADVEAHASLDGVDELRRRATVRVEHAAPAPERVRDDVAAAQLREQRGGRDHRRVGEPAEVDHDRQVAGELLGGVEERRHRGIARVAGAHLEPDDDVGAGGGR
jgi:hypothetical protein